MRNMALSLIYVATAFLLCLPVSLAQDTSKGDTSKSQPFDPHDLSGDWMSYRPSGLPPLDRQANFGASNDPDNKIPEPPLTAWGKEHLLVKAIAHGGLGDKPRTQDTNGVPANVLDGEFPGKDCAPMGAPAQFNFTGSYPVEFVMTPSRIYQIFEDHRELRIIWMNQDHPKNIIPSYMGDSTGKWDGDALVVDTIGFNGRDLISNNLGQRMSDAFHLVERYRRVDHDHLELDMTYYDPKAWGDKSWPGFKKYFKLQPENQRLEEYICNQADEGTYDNRILNPGSK